VAALGLVAMVGPGQADSGAELRATYAAAGDRLEQSPFGRPLWIDSSEAGRRLEGDVHARIAQPFDRVEAILAEPGHLCEVLRLLPNIRRCRVADGRSTLTLNFARRFDQPVEDTYPVTFDLKIERHPRFLLVALEAGRGPLGTRDYRVQLRAIPVDHRRSFLHVHYGYAYGLSARLAALTYLTTRGRDKVGFSLAGNGAGDDRQASLIGGLRGAVERNAMRLYLAIDAHLEHIDVAGPARHERSLRSWLAAIEDYPRQLHEADPEAYFSAKRDPR
jgi:hypothetical protein